jgi:DNA phosphorothioation-dependent restriction protein DptG
MNYQKKVVSLVRTSVQLAGVKHQVPRTMVDVSMTQFAQKLVRKRVGQMDIVNLDFLLGHVNVAIHANTRDPQIPRRHYPVVLACVLSEFSS